MAISNGLVEGGRASARPRPHGPPLLARLLRTSDTALKSAHYRQPWLAAGLLAPQLLILVFFFFIPSWKALSLAFVQVDPFGGSTIFVGLDNFTRLLSSPEYQASALLTLWFTAVQCFVTLGIAGVLAFATDNVVRGRGLYKGIILLPYAIAPAISGVLWAFLFNPLVGPLAEALHAMGVQWDPNLRSNDALLLITVASIWKHICYDYIFMIAALLAVPASVLEAAAMDGAGPIRRFFHLSLPLAMPTVFFLIVMNFVYGLFETFGLIDAVTRGGPGGATNTLVYKVYQDGFVLLDLGSSAAQSVILMIVAVLFTIMQFRALERRVNYQV